MWERACSRKRCASHYMCQLTERFREQARSHNLIFIVSRGSRLATSAQSAAAHPTHHKARSAAHG
ncbi:hypothetical protein C7U57_25960 [Pseudomonas sp. R9.37]|nr:hypothetical protein C7U57_25960 [Pseudomonas sp. R9.37]